MQALNAARTKLQIAVSRTVVIDTGCLGPYGHHMPVNRMLLDHCRKFGIPCDILLNETCLDEITASLDGNPILPPVTYMHLPKSVDGALELFERSNESTFRQLLSCGPALEDGSLVVMHTASFLHLLGVYQWGQLFHDRDIEFRIIFRFPPLGAFDVSHMDESARVACLAFCRQVMAVWRQRAGVQFFLDSSEFESEYMEQVGVKIPQICMPLQFGEASELIKSPSKAGEGPLFLFAGAARQEKGIELLAEVLPRYLEVRPNGRFIIQSLKGAPGEIAARLEELSTRIYPENIKILNRPLVKTEYLRLLSQADAVVLAYDPVSYRAKESQIFYESLGVGRPLIVTDGTLASKRLRKFERKCGLTIDYTADDLLNKLLDFETCQVELSENAACHAPEIRMAHNTVRYLDSLFPFKSDPVLMSAMA